jgi:hypothetical protein
VLVILIHQNVALFFFNLLLCLYRKVCCEDGLISRFGKKDGWDLATCAAPQCNPFMLSSVVPSVLLSFVVRDTTESK